MKKRLTRIAAALAIGTLAATGITLVDDLVATPQDSGWGAPDTSSTPIAGTDASTAIDTTLGDSGWG